MSQLDPEPVTVPAARPKSAFAPLKLFASQRLTVVLFALSLILVFYGTLAQIDHGIWSTIRDYFWSFVVWIPLQLTVKFLQIFFGLPTWINLPGSVPFPGGMLLGCLLVANLVTAYAVRNRITWKRSGILLLHSGVLTLFLAEAITRVYSLEGKMIIRTGESAGFIAHHRDTELAIIEAADPDANDVTVIPQALLKPGQTVSFDLLPFDVEVVSFMVNADVGRATDIANPATAGVGLSFVAVPAPEVSGADASMRDDSPTAYVTLRDKGTGTAIGTYLVTTFFEMNAINGAPIFQEAAEQPVTVGGKTYRIGLRKQRFYKPYRIALHKFTHDVYPGTTKPRNYQSDVQLLDAELGVDRSVSISMNEPMRHRGETFYQSGVLPGDSGTILQVVKNPASQSKWLQLNLIGCGLVALGMLVHFGIKLVSFLNREAKA